MMRQINAKAQHVFRNTPYTRSRASHLGIAHRRASTKAAPIEGEESRPNIYKVFGRSFTKVFLGAMFTFQVLYWAWEEMRTNEIKEERHAEIASLEKEIDAYRAKKQA